MDFFKTSHPWYFFFPFVACIVSFFSLFFFFIQIFWILQSFNFIMEVKFEWASLTANFFFVSLSLSLFFSFSLVFYVCLSVSAVLYHSLVISLFFYVFLSHFFDPTVHLYYYLQRLLYFCLNLFTRFLSLSVSLLLRNLLNIEILRQFLWLDRYFYLHSSSTLPSLFNTGQKFAANSHSVIQVVSKKKIKLPLMVIGRAGNPFCYPLGLTAVFTLGSPVYQLSLLSLVCTQ